MKFTPAHCAHFGADSGAYSVVTDENFDSQITLTDFEYDLVVNHFGYDHIHEGNVSSDPSSAAKEFILYHDGSRVELNLVFPKPGNLELRLYLSARAGFKPEAEYIWFVYLRTGDLWLGALTASKWKALGADFRQDDEDASYQDGIHESDTDIARIATLRQRDVYARDRNIALERLELSGYRCEFDQDHELFVSRFSGNPYLEAHHLVPISFQQHFYEPLDVVENIFCLCPHCHRAVHHAEDETAASILNILNSKRPVLARFGLQEPELHQLYGVEEIV